MSVMSGRKLLSNLDEEFLAHKFYPSAAFQRRLVTKRQTASVFMLCDSFMCNCTF